MAFLDNDEAWTPVHELSEPGPYQAPVTELRVDGIRTREDAERVGRIVSAHRATLTLLHVCGLFLADAHLPPILRAAARCERLEDLAVLKAGNSFLPLDVGVPELSGVLASRGPAVLRCLRLRGLDLPRDACREICADLARCRSLEWLNLACCQFGELRALGPAVEGMVSLRAVTLPDASWDDLSDLCRSLAQCPHVERLRLPSCVEPAGNDAIEPLFGAIRVWPLIALDANETFIGPQAAVPLASALASREGLRFLELSYSGVGDAFVAELGRGFVGREAQLDVLELTGCDLTAACIPRLEQVVAACSSSLRVLSLGRSRFLGGVLAPVLLALCRCSQLERLFLPRCELGDEDAAGLALVAACPSLRRLVIKDNARLGVGTARALGPSLVQTWSLEVLDLKRCHGFQDVGMRLIARALGIGRATHHLQVKTQGCYDAEEAEEEFTALRESVCALAALVLGAGARASEKAPAGAWARSDGDHAVVRRVRDFLDPVV